MAYWPNVISRVGLRFPLYPAFAAPTLYFLVRGLRRRNRNDFLLAGLFLGIGLHGYSAARFVPVVVVIAVGIYWLHSQAAGNRRQVIWALVALAFVSLIVFLPLMRYILEDTSGMFGYRALTRLGSVERPLPAPAWQILLSSLWKAWIMMFRNGGIRSIRWSAVRAGCGAARCTSSARCWCWRATSRRGTGWTCSCHSIRC